MEEKIRVRGDLIDGHLLSSLVDEVAAVGARCEVLSMELGQQRDAASEALLKISAIDRDSLKVAMSRALKLGAEPVDAVPAKFEPAPADGVLPDAFYATTNLYTEVFVDGDWIAVDKEEMDLAVILEGGAKRAKALPMADVMQGDLVLVGEDGVRTEPLAKDGDDETFRFMSSEVSAEKPKGYLLNQVVEAMRRVKDEGKKILFVGGPAIIHTGAGPVLEGLIREGWVDLLFAGNALAVHDIEQALLGTSLGIPLGGNKPSRGGHLHHLWAINAIRRAGSIPQAVESGLLRGGVMHACIEQRVPYVLAGSIRDDGPLPDVVTDVIEAQKMMRSFVPGIGMAIMLGTTLHAVATGNLLPARVYTVCVDINPGTVTKLRDRGSRQSLGIVMDVASFLEELRAGLGLVRR